MSDQSDGSAAGIAALAITNALIEHLVEKGVMEDREVHQILIAASRKAFTGHPGRDYAATQIISGQMQRFIPKG